MQSPIYSGAINSTGSPTVAIAAQVGKAFAAGYLWNPTGSSAGQWSVDGGANWIDFEAGPFSMLLPRGSYDLGVKIQGSAVVGAKVVLY